MDSFGLVIGFFLGIYWKRFFIDLMLKLDHKPRF